MANKTIYHGILLEKEILNEARKYAKEEEFISVALKTLCEKPTSFYES